MNSGRTDDNAGVKFPPPLVYVAFLAVGMLANAWYPIHRLPGPLASLLGGIILAGGIALGPIWGVRNLRAAGQRSELIGPRPSS